jgi:hypothetical protein
MVSRAALIADLKKRKVKGSLSKMNKAQLREMAMEAATDENTTLDVMAGAAATILPLGSGGISLAPLSIGAAKPKSSPKAGQQGSGAYRDFVRANLSKHKGDMKAVAAAYRAQKGGGDAHGQFMKATHSYCEQKGGHFYNVKGEATSLKGKHNHVHGTNPKKVRKMPPGLAGSGHKCQGPGVEQYMEGGHWWNDAWSSVKHAASTVGHDVSKAYHAVQNNPTVREVEKGVANFGVNTLARAGEGLVDAAADTASFVIGQPEIAAAADVGVHELANLAQSGVKKGVDSLIDHTAQSGNGAGALMLPVPF